VRVEEELAVAPGSVMGAHGKGQSSRGPGGREGDGGEGDRGGGPQRTARMFPWRRGVPDQRRGPGGASLHGLALSCAAAAPAPEKRVSLPAVANPAPLTVQTAGAGSGQKSWQVKAASTPVADVGSKEGPGKASEKVAEPERPFLEVELGGKRVELADASPGGQKLHGTATAEKQSVEPGDVAVAGSCAPVVEPLVWVDASESLPATDPEEIGSSGPEAGDNVATLNRSAASPTRSLGGPP
jgi:hypothetical protein